MNKEAINTIFEKLANDAVTMKRMEDAESQEEQEKVAQSYLKQIGQAIKNLPGAEAVGQGARRAGQAIADEPIAAGTAATALPAAGYGIHQGTTATGRQEDVVGPMLQRLRGQAVQTELEDLGQQQAIENIIKHRQRLQKTLNQAAGAGEEQTQEDRQEMEEEQEE